MKSKKKVNTRSRKTLTSVTLVASDDPYFSHELVSEKVPCHVCGGAGKYSVAENGVIGFKSCVVCGGTGQCMKA